VCTYAVSFYVHASDFHDVRIYLKSKNTWDKTLRRKRTYTRDIVEIMFFDRKIKY